MSTPSDPQWMIYGANGYTGKLIAEAAVKRGLRPILAGRRAEEIEALGKRLGLPVRIFALGGAVETARHLQGVSAVLHCAGPFSATSRPMLDACVAARAHYLDITGEIEVFESVFARGAELVRAGITAIPGVGFDVVPTDCLAALLKREVPDAKELTLGFRFDSKPSPGTAKTSVEGLSQGGQVRVDGRITRVGVASRPREIAIRAPGRPEHCVRVPWGDISTAFHSTGIPNIEFYMVLPRAMVTGMKVLGLLSRAPGVQGLLKALITKYVSGPSEEQRTTAKTYLWGEVRNAAGRTAELRLHTPEGYHFTVLSALASVQKLLAAPAGKIAAGALTPSLAFGADFVFEIEGVTRG